MLKKEETKNFQVMRAVVCVRASLVRVMVLALFACALVALSATPALAQKQQKRAATTSKKSTASAEPAEGVSQDVALRILRAEDERRWDEELLALLFNRSLEVRKRAALAAGRIGDERAVGPLATLLMTDRVMSVRAMAAFALGETESAKAVDALSTALKASESTQVRARAVEALGKVAAALPKTEESKLKTIGEAILAALKTEAARSAQPDR